MYWQDIKELVEVKANMLFITDDQHLYLGIDVNQYKDGFMALAADCEFQMSWVIIKPTHFMEIDTNV